MKKKQKVFKIKETSQLERQSDFLNFGFRLEFSISNYKAQDHHCFFSLFCKYVLSNK